MNTVTITFEDAWHILFRKDGQPRTPVAADLFRGAIGEQAYSEIEEYGRKMQLPKGTRL
jgi:hypothetical protein